MYQFYAPQDHKRKFLSQPPSETSSLIGASLRLPDANQSDVVQYHGMLHSLMQIGVNVASAETLLPIINQLLIIMSLKHTQIPSASQPPPSSLGISDQGLLFDFPLKLHIAGCNNSSKEGDDPVLVLPKSTLDVSEYNVLEPLKKDVVIEAIQQYLHTHPYLQIYHHKLSNSLVATLHTGCDDGDVHLYNWRAHSHSKVGFNTYLQYVAKCVSFSVSQAAKEDGDEDGIVDGQSMELLEAKTKIREQQHSNEPEIMVDGNAKSRITSGKRSVPNEKKVPSSDKQHAPLIKNDPKIEPPLNMDNDDSVPSAVQERKLFHGYDIGDQAILVEGFVSTVCTNDGSQIISKKTSFVDSFSTHQVLLIDDCVTISSVSLKAPLSSNFSHQANGTDGIAAVPKESVFPTVLPQPPAAVAFSSVQVSLTSDGLNIALSKFGPQGNGTIPNKPRSSRRLAELEDHDAQVEKDSRPQSRQGNSPQPKLTKKQQEQQQVLLEQQRILDEKRAQQRKEIELKLQMETDAITRRLGSPQLSLCTKDGLQVVCSKMNAKLSPAHPSTLISQRFISPEHTNPTSSQVKELSRTCFSDGSVLCRYSNGTTTIMCADGRLFTTGPDTVVGESKDKSSRSEQSTNEVHSTSVSGKGVAASHSNGNENKSSSHTESSNIWLATTPNGVKYLTRDVSPLPVQHITVNDSQPSCTGVQGNPQDRVEASIKNIDSYSATDPVSQEVCVCVSQIFVFSSKHVVGIFILLTGIQHFL